MMRTGSQHGAPQCRAFSLVEVVVATAILGAVLTLTFLSINTVTVGASVEQTQVEVEKAGTAGVHRMLEHLREAYVVGLPFAGDEEVTFMMPVDEDGDGDVLNDNLEIVWGNVRTEGAFADEEHLDPVGKPNVTFKRIYRFVQTDSYSEATRGVDVNLNGTTTDTFALGEMREIWTAGSIGLTSYPQVQHAITPRWVVQMTSSPSADIDGDGDGDPIFFQNGAMLVVKLLLLDPDAQEPRLIQVCSSVALRNPQ